MKINLIHQALNGLMVLQPEIFKDERGFFMETYRKDAFKNLGLDIEFVQDNHSRSSRGVLRGLHFQWEPPMGKLMRVTFGEAFLVAVDIRKNSPSLGQWYGETVSAENQKMVWAPAGFARGFCTLSEFAEIQYKCTGLYNQQAESGISYNDPEIGIKWPLDKITLSDKDKKAQSLNDWLANPNSNHFSYEK